MEQEIHIGALIRKKLKEDGHSVTWLARQINCDRTNLYLIFEKQHIDVELLIRFSKILHYNFFAQYSALLSENN
jgi:hypothetical protein